MNIYEVKTRTPLLLQSLLAVWEDSVRATHLFLSDGEVKRIKEYVPRALEGGGPAGCRGAGAGCPGRL